MKTVLVAGASGDLGRCVCAQYQKNGWYVTALACRSAHAKGLAADQLVAAEATLPASLQGVMSGANLVISCLGITRQAGGLSYWDVDYKANLNLLREAESAGVDQFAYVHARTADQMPVGPHVAEKNAFLRALQASDLQCTAVAPWGSFSNMDDILHIAGKDPAGLSGDGQKRVSLLQEADLAAAVYEAVAADRPINGAKPSDSRPPGGTV